MNWFARLFCPRTARSLKSNPRSSRPRLESLEDRTVPTVNYYGGALLTNVEAQGVYLGSGWNGSSTPTTLDGYLSYVTNSPYTSALTSAGYGVGTGSATAGAKDGTAFTPGSTISDSTIRSLLAADINNHVVAAPDANRLYVIFVDPNVAVSMGGSNSKTGFLGYHGAFGLGGVDIHYAVITTPGGPAGNAGLGTSAIDQLTDVSSHELAEAITDPNVNYKTLGWYDPQRGEIGDVTENNPNANVRLNGYLVQEVADRNDNLLVINTTQTPPPPPPPPGNVATTTSISAGPVRYYYNGTATVKLTVRVSANSGATKPGGQVNLIYNGQVLATGTLQLINGVEQVSFNITFSSYSNYYWNYYTFTASYGGSSQFGASSASTTVAV
jgi:hypothetical protein